MKWKVPTFEFEAPDRQTAKPIAADTARRTMVAVEDAPTPPPPAGVQVLRTFAGSKLVGAADAFDQVNYDVVLDSAVKTPNGKNTARCSVTGAAHIARANWFAPPGASVEKDPIVKKGDVVAHGGYYRLRSGDPHPWTQCLRLSNNDSTSYGGSALGAPYSVLAAVIVNGKLHVDLADYGSLGSTGVPDSKPIADVPFPVDGQWRYLELVALLDDDPAKGWIELWINGALAVPRKVARTLKLADSIYRRSQHGLGDYHNPNRVSAQVHIGDTYLAKGGRRGPSA